MVDHENDRDEHRPFGNSAEGQARAEGTPDAEGGWRRFTVGRTGRPARIAVVNAGGAIAVRGSADEADRDAIAVRAVKPDGQVIPLEDAAEIHFTPDGDLELRARPLLEVERQVRRVRESFERGIGTTGFLDQIGEIIESAVQGALGQAPTRITFEVTAPRRCDLDLDTTRGGIEVRDVEGEVNAKAASGRIGATGVRGKLVAKTASGAIAVADVDGTALLQTASGAVHTDRVTGSLVIKTASGAAHSHALNGQLGFKSASGALRVYESILSGFYVNTASGACAIGATLGPGEYDARTVSGAVELRVQPGFSGLLTGRTVSGAFRCAIPYRDADRDWRDDLDDEDEDDENAEPAEEPEGPSHPLHIDGRGIGLPGLRIDDQGITLPGVRIGHQGVELPGIHLGGRPRDSEREHRRMMREADRERRREQRRRRRNRWEYLLGDPAVATEKAVRLRVRTVSGSLSIREGDSALDRRDDAAEPITTARHAAPAAPQHGHWPDSELWPAPPPLPPIPPAPPTAAAPAAAPPAQTPPTPPEPVEPASGQVERPASPPDADASAAALPDITAENTATAMPARTAEETRIAILEAVSRKELTPDEALVLLSQLDR